MGNGPSEKRQRRLGRSNNCFLNIVQGASLRGKHKFITFSALSSNFSGFIVPLLYLTSLLVLIVTAYCILNDIMDILKVMGSVFPGVD